MNDMELLIAELEAELRFRKVMDAFQEMNNAASPQQQTVPQDNQSGLVDNSPQASDVPDRNVY